MKTIKIAGLALATALIGVSSFAGIVTTGTSAPSTDVLSAHNTGGTYSRLFDEVNNANHARGQGFNLADGTGTGYQLSAVTIHKNGGQTFNNDTMTLHIYEGTSAQFNAGTGHSTAIDGSDYYVDTGVTSLHTETFTIDGLIGANNYVTFTLATPLTVNEDSDFGFFFTYTESATSSPDYFQYNESGVSATASGRTSITTTDHSTADTSRNMRYLVQGTAIPEPATLGLFAMFGGAVLFVRRRFKN